VLNQLLILIRKWVSKNCRVCWTFKELLELFPMGTVSGIMVLTTYLAGIFDLKFVIVITGVPGSWILLLFGMLFGFTLVLLFSRG